MARSIECWYALKVFYNRISEVENLVRNDGCESYVPMRTFETVRRGVRVKVRRPAVSSLMFIRSTEAYAVALQRRLADRIIVYADRETRIPSAIPEREMRIFMLVTSVDDKGLEYFGDDTSMYRTGDRVRVTDGIFQGAEGCIIRIRGDKRLVVAIEGVVAVATSYIPACFLERIG